MSRIRYRKTIASCVVLAFVALFLTLVLTHTGRAKPGPAPLPGGPVPEVTRYAIAPGDYYTSINIHNPSLVGQPLTIVKRAGLAPTEEATAVAPLGFKTYSLSPGYSVEVDCQDIEYLLTGTSSPPTSFIKGFVSIFTREPLDVVGVYSSEVAAGGPLTLEMLTIVPRIERVGVVSAFAAPGTIYEYSAKFLCGPTTVT